MKKELMELKELIAVCNAAKQEFDEERTIFNLAVETGLDDGILYEYAETEMDDTFDMAVNFTIHNAALVEEAQALRNEHPRYGDKRFISTVATNLVTRYGITDDDFLEEALENARIYVVLEKAGFAELTAKGAAVAEMDSTIKESASQVISQAGETIVVAGKKAASAVSNVVRPYGEVAKGQLEVGKEKAKDLVNKGSKRLMKLLAKIDEKTSK